MNIKRLKPDVINKISAGEVITRPASVVKEILENSIDAGSTRITLKTESAGKKKIEIIDNGMGIAVDEVPLAFMRYATSKLTFIDELDSIETLGFRGEALASIASVAKVSIKTKYDEEETGSYHEITEGNVLRNELIAHAEGTVLTIENLFYNLPVRKKHLENDSKEGKLVLETVEKIALSNPQISFIYISDGKEIFRTYGNGKLLDTIASLYGKNFSDHLINMNYDNHPLKITGYIGESRYFKSTKNHQNFFINGRYVKNKTLSKAFEEVYADFMMSGEHPVCCLFFELPGKFLDINVHPAKTEVKILNESLILLLFKQGVRDNLLSERVVPSVEARKSNVNEYEAENIEEIQTVKEPVTVFEEVVEESKSTILEESQEDKLLNQKISPFTMLQEDKIENNQQTTLIKKNIIVHEDKKTVKILPAKLIGQVFETYILLQDDDELILIDQHAAHERILYEKLSKMYIDEKKNQSQLLLQPIVYELSVAEMSFYYEIRQYLDKLGYDSEIFGEQSIVVRGVPVFLGEPQPVESILKMIDRAVFAGETQPKELIEKIIMMSCKSAIKGNDELSNTEITKIIKDLEKTEHPYSCPHGRPVILKLKEKEFRKWFKR
jgi:DNA mismatch repair protein MutL